MRLECIAAAVVALWGSAAQGGWTERYFGVGSASDQGAACEQARGHARDNSSAACARGGGARGDASFTDCLCTRTWEALHVCNVNLAVSCQGDAPSSPPALRRTGEPEGRAAAKEARALGVAPARRKRPGPEVAR